MNQTKFNQLVKQFIKTKAAAIVYNSLDAQWMYSLSNLNIDIRKLKEDLRQKKESLIILDNGINLLYEKTIDSTLSDNMSVLRQSENIAETTEVLQQKKSFLHVEILSIEETLLNKEHIRNKLFRHSNIIYFIEASAKFNKESQLLINDIEKSMAVANLELMQDTISFAVELTLRRDKINKEKEFCSKINHICNCDFDFIISYNELIDSLSTIISYWQRHNTEKMIPAILKMSAIIDKRNSIPDEKLYQQMQELAKEATRKSLFPWNEIKDTEVIEFFEAIANTNLIRLEVFATKIALHHENKMGNSDNLTLRVQPTFIDSHIESDEEARKFSKIVNCYLLSKAANSVANTVVQSAQVLIDELKSLECEIIQLKSDLSHKKLQIQSLDIDQSSIDIMYANNIQKYPTVSESVTEKFRKDYAAIDVYRSVLHCEIAKLEEGLHIKRKEYNSKLFQYHPQINQCLALTQFATGLRQQYSVQAAAAMRNANPQLEQSTIDFMINYIYDPQHAIEEKSFTKDLNHVCKSSCKYTMSFHDYNKKISELAKHPYWQKLKQEGKCITELANLFTIHGNLPSRDLFESIQRTASKLGKCITPFWGSQLDPKSDVHMFLQAIVKQDILELERLTLKFDSCPKQTAYLKLEI
jgi:hypothetical protein